jgi:photosystem II stability/assembly factor-like uncharacterized protein
MQQLHLHNLGLAIIIAVFVGSCGTDALQVSGKWQFEGLEEVAINKIIPSSVEGRLILATNDGVFFHEDGLFTPAGLQGEEVLDIAVMSDEEMLAGVRVFELDVGEPSLFKTTDAGDSWKTFMGNYGGEDGKLTRVAALAVHPDHSQTLFARGMLNVSQSVDGGQTWNSLYRDWDWIGSNASLLKIDPENPDIIWAGGANTLNRPNLMRTTDSGETWENLWEKLQIFEGGFPSTAYSIAIRPGRSSHLLLGLGVGVFRSTDLGESWESVFDEAAVLTLANSPRSSRTVYASGVNTDRTLFVLATPDFGSTWQTIKMADSPSDIGVNHMVSIEHNGREVLYLGTDRGLYSYRISE